MGFPSCPHSPPTGIHYWMSAGDLQCDNKRNTEICSQAGMDPERVEVMLLAIERILCWVGHIERMEDYRISPYASFCADQLMVSVLSVGREEGGIMY